MKQEAQRLFALRGIEGVSIKDIVAASGQRNNASLHYHFGSKEALVAELLIDGARQIDALRQAMLDALVTRSVRLDVRSVLEALIHPVDRHTEQEGQGTYIRFVANLQMNQRAFFREALGHQWNEGYRRCLSMLRELLPGLPAPLLEQRLSMVGIYGNAMFAAKEAAMDQAADSPSRFWAPPHTLDHIVDTLQAVLECEPSAATLAKLSVKAPRRPRDPGVKLV